MARRGRRVLATELVARGAVPSAFCNVRPAGHHATHDAAMGFCFFNSVAVGIRHALAEFGFQRVALVDFDAHHGNGSEDILAGDERVLMVSVFESGLYPYNTDMADGINMCNVPLERYTRGDALREAVSGRWLPALDAFAPEMIFVSAGFDAHREDDMSHLLWCDNDYAWLTRQIVAVAEGHAHGRIVSVLEGGYAFSALARSVGGHVQALMDAVDERIRENRQVRAKSSFLNAGQDRHGRGGGCHRVPARVIVRRSVRMLTESRRLADDLRRSQRYAASVYRLQTLYGGLHGSGSLHHRVRYRFIRGCIGRAHGYAASCARLPS